MSGACGLGLLARCPVNPSRTGMTGIRCHADCFWRPRGVTSGPQDCTGSTVMTAHLSSPTIWSLIHRSSLPLLSSHTSTVTWSLFRRSSMDLLLCLYPSQYWTAVSTLGNINPTPWRQPEHNPTLHSLSNTSHSSSHFCPGLFFSQITKSYLLIPEKVPWR